MKLRKCVVLAQESASKPAFPGKLLDENGLQRNREEEDFVIADFISQSIGVYVMPDRAILNVPRRDRLKASVFNYKSFHGEISFLAV